MPDDVELRQEILQRTLEEVAQEKHHNHRNEDAEEEGTANPCVICLDAIAEPGVSIPCGHANFDFLCLLSWLEQRPSCPLCMISYLPSGSRLKIQALTRRRQEGCYLREIRPERC